MKWYLTNAGAILAIVSAVLWFGACFVKAFYKPQVEADGWTSAAILEGEYDFLKSARRQTTWNAWAAAFAGLAAVCQAALLWLP